ncbi:MarR family transcriptional regulator [Sphingomonas sp. BIUV-7]|uniref:MarR family transcriptional regulator n=1 Tax=Sphingomonas natans TaxID=3063330 RepID=A0ABT8YA70_9SPHN|nr:MarR family transcriptional regulator [Sphingomonas sp. BIUV-7]MDO6415233.1 MarR family transcriptional regulator [Sphingomonas sp. BIUV-7]
MNDAETAGTARDSLQLGRLGDLVGFRLRRIQTHFGRDFGTAMVGQGLRSGMMSTLALISANPGISQSEAAKAVLLDKSAAVLIVNELERRGFARRVPAEGDRRRHALFTTPEGEAFLTMLLDHLSVIEDRVLSRLTGEELRVLNRLLDRMYEICLALE